MKYWRGYLTAALLFVLTWALKEFAEAHTVLIDMVYPYVSRMLQTFLTDWSAGVDFCIWQMGIIVLVLALLVSIVLMIIFRWNVVQWFGWVLACISVVNLLNTGLYGLNNYSGPISDDIHLEMTEYTATELASAAIYYRDKANELSTQISRDSKGVPVFSDFNVLAKQAGEGFRNMTYVHFQPIFAGSTQPVKELGWTGLFSSRGITGMSVGLTGEAAVDPELPVVVLPYTMCREMAKRMCIAHAPDAEFAAILACIASDRPEFQYSGYLMAYRFCLDALSTANAAASQTVIAAQSRQLTYDLGVYEDHFGDRGGAASGEEITVIPYDYSYELLVNWHIQEIVLPQQTEEESAFDPFDESQVDLSGIANAEGTNG